MKEFVLIIVFVWGIPILLWILLLKTYSRKSKKAISRYSEESAKVHQNLNVWVKNYNIFSKKYKLEIYPFKTLYDFNYCDLIINRHNIVLVGIGEGTFLRKKFKLLPIVMVLDKIEFLPKTQQVQILNFENIKNELEIKFRDYEYPNPMTLVIKNPKSELKKDIQYLKENCKFPN